MNTSAIIKTAIQNKKQIIATYNGHVREMCPPVIDGKSGTKQALFYQFGGTSSSGKIISNSPQNWSCLPMQGLSNVSSRDGAWHTGTNHSKPQTCVDDIDVEAAQ